MTQEITLSGVYKTEDSKNGSSKVLFFRLLTVLTTVFFLCFSQFTLLTNNKIAENNVYFT